jgi:2-methylisocitrate lyase-like PEP mutase family enzyme
VLYAPGLTSADDIARVVKAVDAPINVLLMAGAPSPRMLARLGVRRASTGGGLARDAYEAAEARARELHDSVHHHLDPG